MCGVPRNRETPGRASYWGVRCLGRWGWGGRGGARRHHLDDLHHLEERLQESRPDLHPREHKQQIQLPVEAYGRLPACLPRRHNSLPDEGGGRTRPSLREGREAPLRGGSRSSGPRGGAAHLPRARRRRRRRRQARWAPSGAVVDGVVDGAVRRRQALLMTCPLGAVRFLPAGCTGRGDTCLPGARASSASCPRGGTQTGCPFRWGCASS